MTIIESMPRFLVEKAQFLPKLLVLGSILDIFTCFLPRLLDIIYNFAPIRHKKGMIWHINFTPRIKQILSNYDEVNMKRAMLLIFVFLHLADLPCFSTGFLPTGEELVHQCMEAGIMAGFQQMAQFMNHHMLDTPFRQQQQIGREADGFVPDVADTPS
jgi:hypothetical protein